jgi:cytochrome c peroxidase
MVPNVSLADTDENGKFRTPTPRNIGITAPYMHNGVFDTLAEVIDFYNRRDLDGVVPEVNQNVNNGGNFGNLILTPAEVSDLIAFLETLTDT